MHPRKQIWNRQQVETSTLCSQMMQNETNQYKARMLFFAYCQLANCSEVHGETVGQGRSPSPARLHGGGRVPTAPRFAQHARRRCHGWLTYNKSFCMANPGEPTVDDACATTSLLKWPNLPK